MPKRTDGNHAAVIKALRQIGASVQSLHTVGKGVPDILAAKNGVNVLFEVKDGSQVPSKRRLTPAEVAWHQTWRGPVLIVESPEEAIRRMQALCVGERE